MRSHPFDYYVRSVTSAALAVAIVAATIYQSIIGGQENPFLTGWAGLIVGVYFGSHVTLNGERARAAAAAGREAAATDTTPTG